MKAYSRCQFQERQSKAGSWLPVASFLLVTTGIWPPLQANGEVKHLRTELVRKAAKYIGTPYLYGGVTPKGFDCSGFINYIYGPHIKNLPRRTQDFVRYGRKVAFNKLRPGDLLLFSTIPGSAQITHISLYVGKGFVIHAISDGPKTGIQISDANRGYWNKCLRYARRILPD